MLPNAAGLIWIDDQHVLFSEIKGTGLHMGIVTATVSRSEQREIYFPGHERAMAHYSYLSPDRRWVLISEMDRTATFQPCRLTPFDASSPGRQVGPDGACTGTAWSPDGRWMYFSAAVGGASHLWRQRFPDGRPEQITFGPGEEYGVSVASDGASLVTAVGQQRSAIWIHDAKGERQVTTEGVAVSPQLSLDARRLYYLVRQGSTTSSFELRSMELSSGRSDRLITDRSVTQFDVSDDEREVAFSTLTPEGVSEIWLAAIDRSTPPRRIARNADTVSFAGSDLVFRSLEDKSNFIERIGKDGNGRRRMVEAPIIGIGAVSPDGKWATVAVLRPDESTPVETAVSLETGVSRAICQRCGAFWGPDGKWMYAVQGATETTESHVAIPLGATQEPPQALSTLIAEAAQEAVIGHEFFAPGPNPSTYAFVRRDMQRNLYRIPLP
jgi:hypothetical protein